MSSVEDELAIRNLLARVLHEGDAGPLDAYRPLFTDDAVWSMPGVVHEGVDAIVAGVQQRRAEGLTGPGSGKRHVLTSTEVRLHGEEATVRSVWLLVGGDGLTADLLRFGTYDDVVRRDADGTWRLAERRITFGNA